MNINDLPDDCLLIIFDLIENLKDLVFCYSVCSRWRQLVKQRCHRVRYAQSDYHMDCIESALIRRRSISFGENVPYYYDSGAINWIDPTYPKLSIKCLGPHLFPNLRIINTMGYEEGDDFPPSGQFRDNLIKLITTSNTIKGLVEMDRAKDILPHCGNLEMIVCNELPPIYFNDKNGPNIKQLAFTGFGLKPLLKNYQFFPNLRIFSAVCIIYNFWKYKHVTFPNLEILFMGAISVGSGPFELEMILVDQCPKLKSCYLRIMQVYQNLGYFDPVQNDRLEDLVMQFDERPGCSGVDWNFNTIEKVLRKFPNLKNLALRKLKYLADENVKQIVKLLPNLITLDLKYCLRITESSEDFINHFNNQTGRSINFYYGCDSLIHDDDEDDLPECIDIESNFMENYFHKNFIAVPPLLETIN